MSNDAVRRIMAEVKEFRTVNSSPTTFFYAAPLESDLFEWHFSVRGPPDTAFEEGVYHGRIVLPAEYPLKPPEIILLTPNGRFEVGKRICLSVTAHHQETWQPSWGIRTILTALVGFMPTKAEGVGALDFPDSDRRRLARLSWSFCCKRCGARPIEQLYVPAAVKAGFPGAYVPPSKASSSCSPSSSLPTCASTTTTATNIATTATAASPTPPSNLPESASATVAVSKPASSSSDSNTVNMPTANTASLSQSTQTIEQSQSASLSAASPSTSSDPKRPTLAESKHSDAHQSSATSSKSAVTEPANVPSRDADKRSVCTNAAPAIDPQPANQQRTSAATLRNLQPVQTALPHLAQDATVPPRDARPLVQASVPHLLLSQKVQEPELFFLACAIVVAIFAIVFRRLYVVLTN